MQVARRELDFDQVVEPSTHSNMKQYLLLVLMAASHVSAATFSMNLRSSTFASTSTSAGKAYTLIGTAGQTDASNPMKGDEFSFSGGYWATLTSNSSNPVLPNMSVERLPNHFVRISWPRTSEGFLLEQTGSLLPLEAAANWNPVKGPVATNPTNFEVIVPSAGTAFFRLRKIGTF